jgi:predicted dehydrogenase
VTRRLGVAVVGLGLAVEPHARSLLDLRDELDVRWAASPSPARTAAFADRYPFPVTNDVPQAIADPAVDFVLLLTPPNTHLELGRQCLQAGKHLLVEKPLDADLAHARALVAVAAAAGRSLGVVLQHRFRPGAVRLRELVEAGALGAVQAATVSVPWWRPQAYYDEPGRGTRARDGGGVLLTQAIHTLDLFRSLVGPVEVIAARARTTDLHRMETEDFAAALVELPGGAVGTVLATTAFYPGAPERIELIAAKASATLTGGGLHVAWLDGRSETHGESAGGGGADPMAFSHEAHRRLIADFAAAVREGRDPLASGEEALRTQELVEALLQPGEAGRG